MERPLLLLGRTDAMGDDWSSLLTERFEVLSDGGAQGRTTLDVIRLVGHRPVAWIDDQHDDEARTWAATRRPATLLLSSPMHAGPDLDQLVPLLDFAATAGASGERGGVSLVCASSVLDAEPKRFEPLGAAGEREGIAIARNVLDRWRAGTERYGMRGELLIAAVSETGAIVGVGGLTVCPNVAGARRVRRFYIHPDWRRSGVARRIASLLMTFGAAHTDQLTCNAGASSAAAPFWESMGFARVDHPGITHVHHRRPGRSGGQDVASIGRP